MCQAYGMPVVCRRGEHEADAAVGICLHCIDSACMARPKSGSQRPAWLGHRMVNRGSQRPHTGRSRWKHWHSVALALKAGGSAAGFMQASCSCVCLQRLVATRRRGSGGALWSRVVVCSSVCFCSAQPSLRASLCGLCVSI